MLTYYILLLCSSIFSYFKATYVVASTHVSCKWYSVPFIKQPFIGLTVEASLWILNIICYTASCSYCLIKLSFRFVIYLENKFNELFRIKPLEANAAYLNQLSYCSFFMTKQVAKLSGFMRTKYFLFKKHCNKLF